MSGIANPLPRRPERPERPCQQHFSCKLTHKTVIDPAKDAPKAGCPCAVCRTIRSSVRRAQRREELPTVMASCSGTCNDVKPNGTTPLLFAKAYPAKKFDRGVACDNCGSPMVEKSRVVPA